MPSGATLAAPGDRGPARPPRPEDGGGWGFVWLEFLESEGDYPIPDLGPMIVLRAVLFEPRGLSFDPLSLTPWLYTLPIPILVLGVTAGAAARTLSRLDPISIIERRVQGTSSRSRDNSTHALTGRQRQ